MTVGGNSDSPLRDGLGAKDVAHAVSLLPTTLGRKSFRMATRLQEAALAIRGG
jgi:hypothetical protein